MSDDTSQPALDASGVNRLTQHHTTPATTVTTTATTGDGNCGVEEIPHAPRVKQVPALSSSSLSSSSSPSSPSSQPVSSSLSSSSSPSSLETVCRDIHRRVSAFQKRRPESDLIRRVQEHTRVSIRVIEKALQDYEFASLSLSYNGGKDCLVLLILYLSALYTHFKSSASSSSVSASSSSLSSSSSSSASEKTGASSDGGSVFPSYIPAIYAQSPDPFESMANFVTTSVKRYHLDLFIIRTNPNPEQSPSRSPSSAPRITFRDAFSIYLSTRNTQYQQQHQDQSHHQPPTKAIKAVKAILVGTRRTDPHGANLTHFDRTDHGWPDFMRVHPVIDWHLEEIWCFLRADELREPRQPDGDGDGDGDGRRDRGRGGAPFPYCDMYDQGYTSLGGVGDTKRNPSLRYLDEDGRERFRPAYELTEDDEERLGRQ